MKGSVNVERMRRQSARSTETVDRRRAASVVEWNAQMISLQARDRVRIALELDADLEFARRERDRIIRDLDVELAAGTSPWAKLEAERQEQKR